MSGSLVLGLFSWVGDFFKALLDLIPKIIYLLYASLACILDVLQLFFRKLAGLDVYYVDGVPQTGDLVTNFIGGILGININGNNTNIDFSPLSTVFWSMIVFGLIICFMSVFVAIIKAHYSYDAKTTPIQIVYTGGKAIINMIAIPVIIILGLFVSQALLTALDQITSVSSGTIISSFGKSTVEEYFRDTDTVTSARSGKASDKTYIYYDIFGFGGQIKYSTGSGIDKVSGDKDIALVGAMTQTFSGSLFKVAAYNANRARLGQFKVGATGDEDFGGNGKFFTAANTNNGDSKKLANLIDLCFANNIHLKKVLDLPNTGWFSSKKYFTQFYVTSFENFSKFNVGAIWYYYDLWEFNFIVGFAGCIVCSTIFINIVMGLMTRLIMCVALFLVYPPLFGLTPIKGDVVKTWTGKFVPQVLMAYGSVVGMNLVMMILPFLNEIQFFNIEIADFLAQTLFIIVGLISIKAVMSVMSELVGGADANDTGGKIAEEVGQVAAKAGKMTMGAAALGVKATGAAAKVGFAGVNKLTGGHLGEGIHNLKEHAKDQNTRFGRFVGGTKNAAGQVKGFITGTRGSMNAQRGLDAANDRLNTAKTNLKNLDDTKSANDFLNTLNGQSTADFNADRIRKQAEEYGLSGENLENVVTAATQASTRGATFTNANLQSEMSAASDTYRNNVAHLANYDNERRNRQANVDWGTADVSAAQTNLERQQRRDKGRARYNLFQGTKQFGSGVFKNVTGGLKDTVGGNKIAKEAQDMAKKAADKAADKAKEDAQKKEAETKEKRSNKAEYLKLKNSGVSDADNPYTGTF